LIVVSDTSPVLNLALVHRRLDLLVSLYRQVLIPRAVYEELATSGGKPPLIDAVSFPWLVVVSANDQDRVRQLEADLDRGEAEAIVLAIERRADLLLVDERRGRRIALSLGLRITGLLGVLAEAKGSGLIERVRPILDDLIQRAGFWIGADLYDQVLTELNEM
jgi:predicted nucleic acid-binding protein